MISLAKEEEMKSKSPLHDLKEKKLSRSLKA